MSEALPPANENQRLNRLNEFDVLDSRFVDTFSRFARMACAGTDTPIGLVSFAYGENQLFRGAHGTDLRSTPPAHSFCQEAINGRDVLVVEDAGLDPRFAGNSLVRGQPPVRFYAGAPVLASDGHGLGAVCVLDHAPRRLGSTQVDLLRDLASSVTANLELYQSLRDIRRLALTDSLTGIGNRAHFFDSLHREAARARREHTSLTVIYLDCDGFSAINNTLGHAAGDRLLVEISAVLRQGLRAFDTLGRLGGDEFALILPNTGLVAARMIAERILTACRGLAKDTTQTVSASLGVTTFLAVPDDPNEIVAMADAAMYEAKHSGRDRISAKIVRSNVALSLVAQ